ncbi:MAG: helix-turn-helix domain-containing protein [Acidobacteriia bacterium]|nr:helix-turn-helix domain-containing protein [Terriglobia bacterium]
MPADLLIIVGDRIRRRRKLAGWTQVQLAERIGIDRSFLADVERGKRNISILNLYLIAKALKVSLSQLLTKL